jgi:aminoglycoside phosphotransferase (APT) family kinase protein
MAAVHQVDWKHAGLGFLKGGEDALGEEIELWAGRIESAKTAPLPAFDAATAWLRAHKPEQTWEETLVHGDFKWAAAIPSAGLEPLRCRGRRTRPAESATWVVSLRS